MPLNVSLNFVSYKPTDNAAITTNTEKIPTCEAKSIRDTSIKDEPKKYFTKTEAKYPT
jgi:hypothetical protein